MAEAGDPPVTCTVQLDATSVGINDTSIVRGQIVVAASAPADAAATLRRVPVDIGIVLDGVHALDAPGKERTLKHVRYLLEHLPLDQRALVGTGQTNNTFLLATADNVDGVMDALEKLVFYTPEPREGLADLLETMADELATMRTNSKEPTYRGNAIVVFSSMPRAANPVKMARLSERLLGAQCPVHVLAVPHEASFDALFALSADTFGLFRVMSSRRSTAKNMRPCVPRIYGATVYQLQVHISCEPGTRLVAISSSTAQAKELEASKRYVVEIPALTPGLPVTILVRFSLRSVKEPTPPGKAQHMGQVAITGFPVASTGIGLGRVLDVRQHIGRMPRTLLPTDRAPPAAFVANWKAFELYRQIVHALAEATDEISQLEQQLFQHEAGDIPPAPELQALRQHGEMFGSFEEWRAFVMEIATDYRQQLGAYSGARDMEDIRARSKTT